MDNLIRSKKLLDRSSLSKIKCVCWNINNVNSKTFGEKLCSADFLEKVKDCYIVSLVETHASGQELFIPDFGKPFQLIRGKKGKKTFGGIAVFVRQELLENKGVTLVESKNHNILWIRIKYGRGGFLYIGTVYLSPTNKRNKALSECFINDLESDIEKYSSTGAVMLLGDFNARTASADDFTNLSDNDICYEQGIEEDTERDLDFAERDEMFQFTKRNSEAQKLCKRGRELLACCKNLEMCILNGRTPGDIFGKITCFRWNGCSVVDYAICSRGILNAVSFFKVDDPIIWLSDHSPIKLELNLRMEIQTKKQEDDLEKIPLQYKWETNSKSDFQAILRNSDSVKNILHIDKVINDRGDASNIISSFNSFLKNAANSANIKFRSIKNKSCRHHKWFDDECKEAKNNLGK